jgi:hypothetical protein
LAENGGSHDAASLISSTFDGHFDYDHTTSVKQQYQFFPGVPKKINSQSE